MCSASTLSPGLRMVRVKRRSTVSMFCTSALTFMPGVSSVFAGISLDGIMPSMPSVMRTNAPYSGTLSTTASSTTVPGLKRLNSSGHGSSQSCLTPKLTFFSSWLIERMMASTSSPLLYRSAGLLTLAVHAVFDADEHAVVGERADFAADLVTRLVLVGEQRPGIGLELLETEADALGA